MNSNNPASEWRLISCPFIEDRCWGKQNLIGCSLRLSCSLKISSYFNSSFLCAALMWRQRPCDHHECENRQSGAETILSRERNFSVIFPHKQGKSVELTSKSCFSQSVKAKIKFWLQSFISGPSECWGALCGAFEDKFQFFMSANGIYL